MKRRNYSKNSNGCYTGAMISIAAGRGASPLDAFSVDGSVVTRSLVRCRRGISRKKPVEARSHSRRSCPHRCELYIFKANFSSPVRLVRPRFQVFLFFCLVSCHSLTISQGKARRNIWGEIFARGDCFIFSPSIRTEPVRHKTADAMVEMSSTMMMSNGEYMEQEEEWEREGLLDPAWEKQQRKVN